MALELGIDRVILGPGHPFLLVDVIFANLAIGHLFTGGTTLDCDS